MDAQPRKSKLIKGATGDWEVVIGLEVHAQVTSQSKLFSGASTAFGGAPNSHVALVDAAMPGMLPVINRECIRQAVRTGLGLNAKINLRSVFDRKNYFYPDLPQGYQISQYKSPIVGEGEVAIATPDGETLTVGIERLHLEQDAGKSLHDQHHDMSLVDLNRSGVALMEIVSKPDLALGRGGQGLCGQAAHDPALSRHLRRGHGEGQPAGRRECLGAPARRAARHPLRDQERELHPLHRAGDRARGAPADRRPGGRRPDRAGDAAVRSQQGRDAAHAQQGGGARLPLFPGSGPVAARVHRRLRGEDLRQQLPELPDEKKARLVRDYALSAYDADVLSAERDTADFFEQVAHGRDAKAAANWVINELAGRLNKEGMGIAASPVSAAQLGSILDLIAAGTISGKIAKDVFEIVWSEGGDPRALVEARGLVQVTDLSAIAAIVDEIMTQNPDKVAQAKAKPAMVGWFVGQVMKASGGKANPSAVNELLKRKLDI